MASTAAQSEVLPGATTTASGLFISAAAAAAVEPESSEFFEEKVVGADGHSYSFSSQRCNCCPYGYHIDLDFLQFLNSLYDAESLQKLKRFKRGANNASLSPVPSDDSLAVLSLNLERTKQTENAVLISDGDDVSPRQILDDFDASFCRATAYSPNRLVQQRQLSGESNAGQRLKPSDVETDDAALELSLCLTTFDESIDDYPTTETNVKQQHQKPVVPLERNNAEANSKEKSRISLEDVFNAEGGRLSPTLLLAIREQLVESLRRTKELEEQVKVIPILKSRISMLKEENSLLTLSSDRTFSNASVGEFSGFDDTGSSKAEIPLSTGGRVSVETSELISNDSDRNSTEGFSAVSLESTHRSTSSLPIDSNFKTVYCCTGVSDVAQSEEDSREERILSSATTSDSCVGTDVDCVDCGTGDEILSCDDDDDNQKSNIPTKQSQSPSETVADPEIRSTGNETGEKPLNACLIPTNTENSDELESPKLSVSDPKRFQSVATQCEDEDKTGRNDSIENSDFQPPLLGLPIVHHLSNSRSTQTDKFLLAEYSSKIVKIEDHENVPGVDDKSLVNAVKLTKMSKKRISFGEVTIYETEISDDDDDDDELVIDEDTSSSTDCETESGIHNEAEDTGNHPLPSYLPTQESTAVESESAEVQSPIVECIVTERVLESPRCGVSVIIDDSNGSSTTSSDSEDSSALTILEVIPNGKSSSISMAEKSVDEYFDAGIVVEEDSAVDGDETKERKNDEEVVVLVINETTTTSLLHATNEDTENAVKLPDKADLSFNLDEQTEAIRCNQHSTNSLTNSVSDESSVIYKMPSETYISYPSSSSSKGRVCDECIDLLSSDAVSEANADRFPQPEFPVTDRLEVIRVQKKHPKNPDVISAIGQQVTGVCSTAEDEVIKSTSQMSSSDPVNNGALSNGHSEWLDYGQVAQSSSATKKKIIITETIIERRRVDHSAFDDQTQSTEDRSFGSEDQKDDHQSRSENSADYFGESAEKTVAVAAPEVTKPTPEDISNSNQVKDTETGQTSQPFQQPAKTDRSDCNDLTETGVNRRESIENFREDHSGTRLNAEKQLEGDISEAMSICNQWLQSPEETRLEKDPVVDDSVRKHWFGVCGRKTASAVDIKKFLSLASSYSDALLQRIVNMADSDGNSALHYAVSYSNTDIIRHLLDTGCCDVNRQNKAGYTAVMLAALRLVDSDRNRSVIERLFQLGNVNIPSSLSGQTALMLAASHGHNVTVQTLLTLGADVNAQDEDGSTALMCASEHGHVDVIRTLLSHSRCDSTLADVDGSTALSIAMEEGHQEIGVLIYAHLKAFQGSQRSGVADEADGN